MCMFMYINILKCIYIYIYTHVYRCIYTYIFRRTSKNFSPAEGIDSCCKQNSKIYVDIAWKSPIQFCNISAPSLSQKQIAQSLACSGGCFNRKTNTEMCLQIFQKSQIQLVITSLSQTPIAQVVPHVDIRINIT